MSNLVTVACFPDPEEAICANGFLQAQGIYSIIRNEHHLSVAPHWRVALGGFDIICPRSQREIALGALKSVENTPTHENPNTQEKDVYKLRKNWLWLPLSFLHGVPFVPAYHTKQTLIAQAIFALLLYGAIVAI